jgi:FlaA1/EpsC-like NDP-sugar epimerase
MSRMSTGTLLAGTVADAVLVGACWHITYLFRLGFERWQPGRPWYDDYVSIGVIATYLLCIQLFGARKALWRFFAFDDLRRLAIGCGVAGLLSAVAVLLLQLAGVARAVLLLHPLFSLMALALARMIYRMVWEHAHTRAAGGTAEHRYAIVLGAGEIARRLLAGLHQRNGWHVLMLLDDNPAMVGVRIAGVPVRGSIDSLQDPHVTARATHVIVALPESPAAVRDRALSLAQASGLVVLLVPTEEQLRQDQPVSE